MISKNPSLIHVLADERKSPKQNAPATFSKVGA